MLFRSKAKVEYIDRYNQPPLWVIIKQLTFHDLFIMTGLLKPAVINDVLKGFGLNSGDRDYFLNCLDVFRYVRNNCAHFELINRFRTPGDTDLRYIGSKHPINPSVSKASGELYRIKLYDTLLVLSSFVDVSNIAKEILSYRRKNYFKRQNIVTDRLFDRMGCKDVNKWKALIKKNTY